MPWCLETFQRLTASARVILLLSLCFRFKRDQQVVVTMSKSDSVPTVNPNGPRNNVARGSSYPVCSSCRYFRVPDWIPENAIKHRPKEVAFYAKCARWRETRDANLLLVVGMALERDEEVRCAEARAVPEMCGPTGRTWEAGT